MKCFERRTIKSKCSKFMAELFGSVRPNFIFEGSFEHCTSSGTIQAILLLAETGGFCSADLLKLCSKILSTRSLISTDISFHCNVLKLVSELVKFHSQELKKRPKNETEAKELSQISQDLTSHCFVVLNILQHLIDCNAPDHQAIKSQSQVSQNSITNPNASPIKLKSIQELTEKKKDDEQSKKVGQFNESHHYMRLFDNLRHIYAVERNSLTTQEKVKNLMVDTLACLKCILEYTTCDKTIGQVSH